MMPISAVLFTLPGAVSFIYALGWYLAELTR